MTMIEMLATKYIDAFDSVFEAIFGTNPMDGSGPAILIGILISCFVVYAGSSFLLTVLNEEDANV